jgi:predicted Zn-dependent protease with MMP-like domain
MYAEAAAPTIDDIAALAEAAWRSLPAAFRALAGDVAIHILDFAEDEVLRDLDIEDPFELTGLYVGVDLTQRSIMDPTPSQPRVFLYRRPILDEWIDRGGEPLGHLVAHVLIHEIGHHFGLSDAAMDALLEGGDEA